MDADAVLIGFADWLRDRLRAREMTQADLARAMGLHSGTVSRWLTAKQRPDWEYCDRIAEALHIPPEDVLTAAGYLFAEMTPDPDSPAEQLCRKIRGLDLTYERLAYLNALVDSMASTDRSRGGSQ